MGPKGFQPVIILYMQFSVLKVYKFYIPFINNASKTVRKSSMKKVLIILAPQANILLASIGAELLAGAITYDIKERV